jgi:hypothetical protein
MMSITIALNGIGIDIHGTEEQSNYYVFLYQRITNPEVSCIFSLPEIVPEKIEKFKKFCTLMKIPYSQPEWHLASYG